MSINKDSYIISVCMSRIHDPTNSSLLHHMIDAADAHNIKIVVYHTFEELTPTNTSLSSAATIFSYPGIHKSDGIIILGETIKSKEIIQNLYTAALKANIPVITVDHKIEGCCNLLYDYANAFEEIVEHIVTVHKCKHINMIAGIEGNEFSDERIRAFERVLKKHNIDFPEHRLGYGDFWSEPAKYVTHQFLKDEKELPEAIICANDAMAIACCAALEEAGYSVPKDVFITGFDGIEREKYHTPRLTTAHQNQQKAAELLIEKMASFLQGAPYDPCDIVVPYEIVFSESCSCKKLQFTSGNKMVNKLYNKLVDHEYFSAILNSIAGNIIETFDQSPFFDRLFTCLGYVYSGRFIVAVREKLLLEEDYMCAKQPLYPGEPMRIIFRRDYYTMSLDGPSFQYGDPIDIGDPSGGCTNHLYLPLFYQERTFGFIAVEFDPNTLQYDNLRSLCMELNHAFDTLFAQSALVHANEKLKEMNLRLEEMYVKDPMTELFNRRGFYRELNLLLNQAKQSPLPTYAYVASIDLDGLKYINDTFGHAEGDFAIKSVGDALNQAIGENGVCSRFGGDEFMVFQLIEHAQSDAIQKFETSFQKAIDSINQISNKPYKVEFSIGTNISVITEDLDIDALMKLADDKMYNEKSSHKHFREKPRND